VKLTKYERETVITFNDAEQEARVYTCSPVMLRKMDSMVKNCPGIWVEKQDEVSKTYICPKRLVSVRKPPRLSDEQRQKMAANFGR